VAPFVIELSLRSAAQLFESRDPPPLGPKALHPQILDSINEQWGRAPRGSELQLIIRLPASSMAEPQELIAALRDYSVFRADSERREIRKTLRDGRIALLIGLAFLIVVGAIAEVIHGVFSGRFALGVASGLEIFGWVALWYPAELLLYEWLPAYRRRRLMQRLSVAMIEFRSP
jgi:hypothetical protein